MQLTGISAPTYLCANGDGFYCGGLDGQGRSVKYKLAKVVAW